MMDSYEAFKSYARKWLGEIAATVLQVILAVGISSVVAIFICALVVNLKTVQQHDEDIDALRGGMKSLGERLDRLKAAEPQADITVPNAGYALTRDGGCVWMGEGQLNTIAKEEE